MNKKYLDLYEKLFDLNTFYDEIMKVSLEDNRKEPQITIILRKSFLDKEILKKIIDLCEKAGARMGLIAYGVIRIEFPKTDGSISVYD